MTPEAVAERLAPPDMEQVRVQAGAIRHPVLRPIEFNSRDGLSPDEGAVLAVLANPTLRAARDRRGVARAQLLQAGILPNPRLSLGLEMPVGGDTKGTVNAFGVGLGWDVTSPIARDARVGAARAQAASMDLEVAWEEWQVAEAAKLQLYRLWFAEKELASRRQAAAVRREAARAVQEAVRLGEKTALDLSDANAAWQKAKLAVAAAELKGERERLALNRALGLPPGQAVPLQEGIVPPSCDDLPSLDELMDGIEQNRLDLHALRLGYESREDRLRAAILSRFPRIKLGLSAARDTDNVGTVGPEVSISLPFFDRNQGRIAVERATRQELFDEYAARLFAARSGIARILAEVRSARGRIEALEKGLPELERSVETYRAAAHAGSADLLEYLALRGRLHAKQLEAIESRAHLAELAVALEIAAGRYLPEGGSGDGGTDQMHHEPPGGEPR